MGKCNYLSLDSSVLYRCCQKYFDKQFDEMELGYAHIIFLTIIYENEGISMVELANKGSFDKGTITKSLAKLQENGYVRIEANDDDKRKKLLYSTDKAQKIMPKIYLYKQSWWDYLSQDLSEAEFDEYIRLASIIQNRAREYNHLDIDESMPKIFGIQKLSLLDYPTKLATTIFIGGCNLRCPFCHNRHLVYIEENQNEIDTEDVLDFLKKRTKLIDGVCISGGEPLIHDNIDNLLRAIKDIGYQIKLDTNGLNPSKLNSLIDDGLVDYVAVDIKNSIKKYELTTQVKDINFENILKTIDILMHGDVNYEFRTTVVKELHEASDIEEIAKLIKGAKRYYLQSYIDRDTVISKGFSSYSKEEMEQFKDIANKYVNTNLRGVE